ncbi:MAG: tetratricopeptide repeat protein [Firmicutes bacterium]|nr:tetratricopeptide repeat protein [Bacillota bacterium]
MGNVPEDWEGLERLIREGEMESKEKVLQIIETVSDPDTRERQLRTLDGGRPFRYMLEEMFPSLRRVVYRVEFTVKEYSLEESGAIMQKNPEQLNHYELTRLYRSFPEHSAKQEEIGELIITMFPDDSVAASNTIARLIEKDEPEKASAYVESASRLPEAYNTVGAYYLLMENPDEAEEYFHKALEAASREDMPYTIEEVQTHLQEVEKKREDLQIRER